MGEPRAKGVLLKETVAACEEFLGPAKLDEAIASLEPNLRDAIRYRALVVGSWYPLAWHRALLGGLGNAGAPMRKIGRAVMAKDLRGVYRPFAMLLGPDRVLGITTRLFNKYYDTGAARVLESRARFAEVEWTGCTGFDANLWGTVLGACEVLVENSGGRAVRVHAVAGGNDGDDSMRLTARWQ